MSRSKQAKLKREKRINRIIITFKTIASVIFLMIILYGGLTIVDKSNRSVLMMDDNVLFEYDRVPDFKYNITFLGDIYLLDASKFENLIANTKDDIIKEYKKLSLFIYNQDIDLGKAISNVGEKSKEIISNLKK